MSPKTKYNGDTDRKQVPWGKDEKNFEKRVKEYVKLLGGKLYGMFRAMCFIGELYLYIELLFMVESY